MHIIRTPKPRLRIARSMPAPGFWSVHTHSRYSNNDALPKVKDLVARAKELGQPALGLTDHGNMAGSVELYQECMKAGIKPFPGSELYFVPDIEQHKRDYADKNKKASRFHLGVVAYSFAGYQNLVHLSTTSHLHHFHKPLVDYTVLAQLAEEGRTEGLAVTTGCFFGYLSQLVVAGDEDAAERWALTLKDWFPSVYIEIQNHRIQHDEEHDDDWLADRLVALAGRCELPVVITQDSHYDHEQDRADHEKLKRLVAWGATPDDAVFPGDGFHLADGRWIADHHRAARLEAGLQGLADLLGKHELRIPVLDSYSYAVPEVVDNPQAAMEYQCVEALKEKFPHTQRQVYAKKLGEEIATIKAADMAGYMMLVAMVTDYMRENGIVFQTRGSAAGSLVCWLLGITQVDPIKWDLRFERFLSRDRTKPPDIDLDIAHDRRQEVLDWLNTRFAAHQIGSWATYSMEKSDDVDGGEDKGSLLRRYFSSQRTKDLKADEIPKQDLDMLWDLSRRELFSGMGTNAAGVVITSTQAEFDALVPLHYMTRGGYVSQYHKDDIEALGLVKLDILGSKTLTVLRLTCDNLGWDLSYLDAIPLNNSQTFTMLKQGDTAGVFQLEGGSSRWGVKRLQPSHVKDVIAAMALFRPATMSSGGTDAFIARKHKQESVPARHRLLETATSDTYGVLLYQEQVIDILRSLGMGAEDLTKFLKAVKASNKNIGNAAEVIKGYRDWLQTQCSGQGMTDEDEKFLDEAIAGFAEYGFNRAHATVYGLTAYRTAYLARHHGLEFHAALLAVASGGEKEPKYLSATRSRGIRVGRPHLNASAVTYAVDKRRGTIRRGFTSIKGIGERAAGVLAANQPYSSVEDLVRRSPARPISGGKTFAEEGMKGLTGILAKLRDAGILDDLPETEQEVKQIETHRTQITQGAQ